MIDEEKSLMSLQKKVLKLVFMLLWMLLGYIAIKISAPVQEVALAFFVAILINYLLSRPVTFITSFVKSRLAAVLIIYLSFISSTIFIIYSLSPAIAQQIIALRNAMPYLIENLDKFLIEANNYLYLKYQIQIPIEKLDTNELLNQLLSILAKFNLIQVGDTLGALLFSSVNVILFIVLTTILSFYLLVDGDRAWHLFLIPFSPKVTRHLKNIKAKIDALLFAYIVGQFQIASLTSLVMLTCYFILGIPYALLFAFAQMLEIIPVIGTWTAIIPCVSIIFLTSGGSKALIVTIVYLIYTQFVRDNFVAPRIMGDALGLHPLAIILAIIIGAKTQGVFGIIFALPILAMCNAVIDYFAELNRLKVRVSR
jgi:predicted PurR-regulated permease PerM